MNKALKWTLIVFGGLIILLLLAALILPVVFKDDIKAAIEKEVAKSVNADVSFETFDLSLFTNFPNLTASMEDLGVINREPFAGHGGRHGVHDAAGRVEILHGDQPPLAFLPALDERRGIDRLDANRQRSAGCA